MFKTKVVMLLVLALAVSGCTKTVEGEAKRWSSNLQKVKKLSALHPGFADALAEQQKKAEAVMKAAKEMGDKEAAAKKMGEANSLLSSGFVSKLSRYDDRVRKLREKIVDVKSKAKGKTMRGAADEAARDARKAVDRASELLKKGAKDAATAGVLLGKVDADLKVAERNLDSLLRQANKAAKDKKAHKAGKDKKGADKDTKGTAAAGKDVKKPAAAAPWTCSYCDKKNPASAAKCANCGAARE